MANQITVPDLSFFRSQYPIVVNNTSGEEIPPGAILRIAGITAGDAPGPIVSVAKPNSTFQRRYLINSPIAIPSNSSAVGYAGMSGMAYVSGGTATGLDDEWGATDGQWYLTQHRPGFILYNASSGAGSSFNNKAYHYAQGHIVNQVLAKGTVNSGGSNTVDVWSGSLGTDSDTGLDIAGVYNYGADLVAEKFIVEWLHGKPYAKPLTANVTYRGTAAANINTGASGNVTRSTGTTDTVTNLCGPNITNGDAVIYTKISDTFYVIERAGLS